MQNTGNLGGDERSVTFGMQVYNRRKVLGLTGPAEPRTQIHVRAYAISINMTTTTRPRDKSETRPEDGALR